MAMETVGVVTTRVVGHSVKNRLNELHLSWTIDNWTEVQAAAAAAPYHPDFVSDSSTFPIYSPKVSSRQLGSSSKGSWQIDVFWRRNEEGVVNQMWPSLALKFDDTDGAQKREMAMAHIATKISTDFPPRVLYELDHGTHDDVYGHPRPEPMMWGDNDFRCATSKYGSYGGAEDALSDAGILRQIFQAKSLVVELELTFLQCPYRETFACMPCCITLNPNSGLLDLYKTQTLTDFVFISSDKKELPVHRVILAASCEVFKAMLTHDTKEKRTGICQLDDIDYETLQLMVESFYGSEISSWTLRDPATLYGAADKYDLGKLKDFCRRPLEYTLTVKNAVDRYVFGLQYDLPDLIAKCVEFVRSTYDEFVEKGGAAEVVEKLPDAHRDFFRMVGAWNGPIPTKRQRTM